MHIINFFDKHQWIANLLTIFVTVSFAAWQISRQFKNTIASQRASKLDELHLVIYDQIASKVEKYGDALASLGATVQLLPHNLENNMLHDNDAKKLGVASFIKISNRNEDLRIESYNAGRCYIELLHIIDKYEIAFSDFGNMRIQIHNKYELMSKYLMELSSLVHPYLPYDVEKEDQERLGIKVYPAPTPDMITLNKINELSCTLFELNMDMSAFIHDLRIETQNKLLSPLFGDKQVPRRNPPDPSTNIVLRADT